MLAASCAAESLRAAVRCAAQARLRSPSRLGAAGAVPFARRRAGGARRRAAAGAGSPRALRGAARLGRRWPARDRRARPCDPCSATAVRAAPTVDAGAAIAPRTAAGAPASGGRAAASSARPASPRGRRSSYAAPRHRRGRRGENRRGSRDGTAVRRRAFAATRPGATPRGVAARPRVRVPASGSGCLKSRVAAGLSASCRRPGEQAGRRRVPDRRRRPAPARADPTLDGRRTARAPMRSARSAASTTSAATRCASAPRPRSGAASAVGANARHARPAPPSAR